MLVAPLAGAAAATSTGAGAPDHAVDEPTVQGEHDNETAVNDTETNETAANETDTFGTELSTFMNQLRGNVSGQGFGMYVAVLVVQNNPGNAPSHAGPPAFLADGNETQNKTHGPPWMTDGKDKRGPPWMDDGPINATRHDTNETTDANETDDGRGPPWMDDKPTDETDDANETTDANETDDGHGPPWMDDDDEDEEKGGGPPDHAGGPNERAATDG